jgi:hypothetical protein
MTPKEFSARYEALAHAIQAGTGLEQGSYSKDGEPKHLRVGITLARVEHTAVARLCMAAGIFTEAQYFEAVIAELEVEKATITARLEAHYGGRTKINLV